MKNFMKNKFKCLIRPNKRNCVNTETGELLKNAFLEFEADEDMYCAVLHGIGNCTSFTVLYFMGYVIVLYCTVLYFLG